MISFKKTFGFTMLELMVTVMIISIIAAFAVPNYQRSLERAYLKDATNNLIAIHAANQIYKSENGEYWPPADNQGLTAINDNLGLNIIANGLTYDCDTNGGAGNGFKCTASRSGGGGFAFDVLVNESPIDLDPSSASPNPSCTGTCPAYN